MPTERGRILVVDDHPEMVRVLADALSDKGFSITVCTGGAEAIASLKAQRFSVTLCDLRMADVDGFDVLDASQRLDPAMPFIVMTAFGGVESAVDAMKKGAFHYVTKPFRLDEVLLLVERAAETRALRDENVALKRQSATPQLLGSSAKMRELERLIDRAAGSDAPVLLRGESGTGKELVARRIHDRSVRSAKPFVPVNCTALSAQLLESELFGHVKGAFTGAVTDRRGLFLEANGGTLFLDEIGDMGADLQSKLLRVLEDGQLRPVGSDTQKRVDVRIVAATHQDLEARIREGKFRQDLFYRLNVLSLRLPPLRERKEDIPELSRHFFKRAVSRHGGALPRSLSDDAVAALTELPYEGNVRELENLVDRLVVLGGSSDITAADVKALGEFPKTPRFDDRGELVTLRQLEAEYIAYVLARCSGNKTKAAEVLGIDVSTLHRREARGK